MGKAFSAFLRLGRNFGLFRMKDILTAIDAAVRDAVLAVFGKTLEPGSITVTPTRKEHQGDYTVVTFPLAKELGQAPPKIAEAIAAHLAGKWDWIERTDVVQGFLNISLSNRHWMDALDAMAQDTGYWKPARTGEKVLVEFSSPNTNKPLHLGHIRNILLGWSMYRILQACGHDVWRVQIVNDRGIAICKSMVAWQQFGEGQTPESTGIKSDHFVGDWYVRFEKEFSAEYKAWQATAAGQAAFEARKDKDQPEADFFKGYKNHYFNTASALGRTARDMLLAWEAHDPDTLALWRRMNAWVYAGFDETYRALGVDFDKLYFESETYLLGKDLVEEGLSRGVFFRKADGSVWVDLTDVGLDEKLLLRSDGTSVYMTQDIGTAQRRYEELGATRMIYVVADEQNYHFQALFAILEKLGAPYAAGLHHLSYGMVDLPEGKMKSREGTVVDADDLLAEVIGEADAAARERDNHDPDNVRQIGLAALKYFIIKVDPKKRMIFDPKASVDLQGQTGPYIQNAYVRIRSILRKGESAARVDISGYQMLPDEKLLLNLMSQAGQVVQDAAREYNPSLIAHYSYQLAKEYHRYYHDVKVLQAESAEAMSFRLRLIESLANLLADMLDLLGIGMPDKM